MIFVFDNCVLDTGRRELRRGASVVSVQPQVFDLLEFLIRNRGRVMSRNAVLDAIWHGRLVSESTLATRINAARSAIGDDGRCQRLIQTFPRVGFRFIGEVHETQEERQPTRTGISPLQVPVGVDPQIDAERRHLTVLSCDFIGLRELATQLDPEELRSVIRSCYMCCSEVAARWAGSVASFADDAATIHFSFPQAHEDDAERAVRAGLEILARVKSPEICPGNSLSARLGAATGIVVIGSTGGAGTVQDGLAFGETPALAAALRRVAAPGSIIIASSTRDLLGSLFEYEAVGPFAIEGLPGQLKAWRVISPRPAESRFEAQRKSGLVPFVGREEELALQRKVRSSEHPATLTVMNDLAWVLATSDAAEIRNGTNAVHLAEEAVAATHRRNPDFLATLAAAYAETHQFDKAVAAQQEAIGLLKSDQEKKDYVSRLKLYQAHKPYRVTANR